MIETPKVLKNIGVLFIGRVLAHLVGFAVTIVLTRSLTPGEFGEFYYLISYLTYFMILIDFGMNSLAVRAIVANKSEAGTILSSLVTLKLIFTPIVFGLCIGVALLLGHDVTTHLQPVR